MIKFHHIGFIVKDIEAFEKHMIFEKKELHVYDPIQKAKLALYKNFSDVLIELIQPLESDSYTWNFMIKNDNTFYHHICYEVKNSKILAEYAKQYRLISLLDPIPATLFEGKCVAFYYTRNKMIVEFLILES